MLNLPAGRQGLGSEERKIMPGEFESPTQPPVQPPKQEDQPEDSDVAPETEQKEGEETETPETRPLTDEEKADKEAEKQRAVVEADVDITLGWMTRAEGLDPQIFELFKEQMEKEGVTAEEMDETAELIKQLSKIFEKFDKAVESLKDNPDFKDIEKKQAEIKKAICLSVINGHLSASDIPQMVTGVTIETAPPKEKPDGTAEELTERDKDIRKMMKTCGYDVVAYWDGDSGEIIIFNKALRDDARTSDGRALAYTHIMNHEMSHAFTERYLAKDKELIELCDIVIENRTEVAPFMTEHVRNTLKSIDKIEEDFPKAEEAMSGITKEQFTAMRKRTIAIEMMTDFTAIYLQSNGTPESFIQKCEASAMGKGNDPGELTESAKKVYETFYKTIKRELEKNKGKVYSHDKLPKRTQEDYDESDLWGGYYEPSQSFAQPSPQGKGGGDGSSPWKLFTAIADEIGGTVALDKVIGG